MVKLIDKHYKGQCCQRIEEYLIDTDAELKDLPKAPAGSYAISVESGKTFYVNSKGEWPEDPSKYTGTGGMTPEGTIQITENGTHDVTEYASAEVMVVPTGDGYDALNALVDGSISGDITLNVQNLKDSIFKRCKNLTGATLPSSYDLGNIVNSSYVFAECTKLEYVIAPLAERIANYAFSNCTSLNHVEIPLVKSLGSYVFNYCEKLEIIDLAIESIGNRVFSNCMLLKTVILRNNEVVTLSNIDSFINTPFRGKNGLRGTFYVPQALIEEYTTTATNWPALYAEGFCDFLPIEGSEYE